MANEQIIPSIDPANEGSLPGIMREVFKKQMQNMDGQLPAQVIAYDRSSNTATVQPLITRITTDGQPYERATVASVPVLALGGGGFYVNFPLKPGDKGWIEASDRDISLFMQGGEMAQPNTVRMHNFSDGRFVPDVLGSYTFDSDDEGKMVIASLDGQVKISLSDTVAKIKGVKVEVEAESDVTVTAPNTTVNGDMTVTGKSTLTGGATIAGNTYTTHYHDTPDGLSGPPLGE